MPSRAIQRSTCRGRTGRAASGLRPRALPHRTTGAPRLALGALTIRLVRFALVTARA